MYIVTIAEIQTPGFRETFGPFPTEEKANDYCKKFLEPCYKHHQFHISKLVDPAVFVLVALCNDICAYLLNPNVPSECYQNDIATKFNDTIDILDHN